MNITLLCITNLAVNLFAWLPAACLLLTILPGEIPKQQDACYASVQSVRVSMTSALKQQMQECFRMMDVNNSGGVDPHELGSAFRVSCDFVPGKAR